MPTLDWIGKQAVINHHREVPFHLLECDAALSAGDPGAGNLLVEGDNLLALKALLPYYAGKVKCIYIDPPYNTGKENWVYNDNVNSPEMRKWLGKVVGAEAEDLCRHDKWLCMMYPRLVLLREMLADDGVIFISIGKQETGHLRVLCDEIFGVRCLIETFVWQIEGNVENQEDVTATHEYVIAYERSVGAAKINRTIDPNVDDGSKLYRDFVENSVVKNGHSNPAAVIELPAGFPCTEDSMDLPKDEYAEELMAAVEADEGYIKRELHDRFAATYPVRLDDMVVEGGELVQACRVYSGWQNKRKLERFIDTGCVPLIEQDGARLSYFLSATGVPTYRKEGRAAHFVETMLRNMGTTEKASNELERLGLQFSYPKPVPLVRYLLSLYAQPGDTVLDAFAGSGTTGEAALALGATDPRGLKYVLVELDREIAAGITQPRLKALVDGYSITRGSRTVTVHGVGGGFRYCKLGLPLFDEAGRIRDEVSFAQLARHVYFTETGSPLPDATAPSPLLGVHEGRAVYLLYNGILGDKRSEGGNVLTTPVLLDLPPYTGPKVIYGEACLLSPERLQAERITFKQVPYQVKVN